MKSNSPRFILMLAALLAHGYNFAQTAPEDIKLMDYRPKSIYKVTVSKIEKAKYPAIDIHSHPYAGSDAALAQWVKNKDLP